MKRVEGLSKLTGREKFVDDLLIDGALWGATLRSPAPRGRILDLRFGAGVDWSDFVVVDHRDIPGENAVRLIDTDQPVLASDYVRHLHEPIVLLAHPSRDELRRALLQVEVLVEPDPPALDFRELPRPEQIQYGTDNVLKHLRTEKGDVDRALAGAPIVVEGIYETGAQEHLYLETQGMAAWEENGVVTVTGSMQCPYYVLEALCFALDRNPDQVRVIQAATGGGFGGKEEYPSGLAIHSALLALKAGRPVKIVYDRTEDMAVTTKRHPSLVKHRTGLDNQGRFLAQDVEVLMDGGAYVTLSPVVLSRGLIHAAGPYHCENVRVDGRAMLTNSPPFGAFRGFGAPQTQFAVERHMDRIATRIGIDPVELRRRNLIRDGQTTATGQVIEDGVDRCAVMTRALDLSEFAARRVQHAIFNRTTPDRRRGIGLATFFHGAGFTGAGEVHLGSVVHVAGLPDGTVEIRTANVEMGQGAITVFTQIVADILGCEPSEILVAQPDTHRVPDSGPTVASRTSMIVGRLVEEACHDLMARLGLGDLHDRPPVPEAIREWHGANEKTELVGMARYEKPPGIHWDEDLYRGDAYGTYAWGAYVADVEVDLRTYVPTVRDFVAVQEIGRVLNETLARGQIQGGVVQALGWALTEECKWADGGMANAQLTNYIVPTSNDVPPIRVEFLEVPYPHGAQGAKGIGELPFDGVAPAVANAVAGALGRDPCRIPLTAETLLVLAEEG
ncbi:MAG: xanthine dehydrogenase family protein [Gemmatimonadetes bacterium]|nr:xanthine dehydrogenase family protein [Gemmatimonadota bacterium]